MICFSEFIIYKSTTDNLVYVPENRLFAYFTDRNVCDTFLRKLICVWYINNDFRSKPCGTSCFSETKV